MKKKIFKIVLIIVVSIIILIAGFMGYLFLRQNYEISKLPDYYQNLAKECKKKESVTCCLSSVAAMAKGSYKIKTENDCLTGYRVSQLRCIGSYVWCEPIWSDYYLELTEKCREKHGGPCCMESVNFMEKMVIN